MIYVMLQSVVILSLVFGGGLWFGGALSKWTEKPPAKTAPVQPVTAEADESVPAYHGFEPSPVSEPRRQPVAMPDPVVETSPARPRTVLLYPINQFGVMSVTQARNA